MDPQHYPTINPFFLNWYMQHNASGSSIPSSFYHGLSSDLFMAKTPSGRWILVLEQSWIEEWIGTAEIVWTTDVYSSDNGCFRSISGGWTDRDPSDDGRGSLKSGPNRMASGVRRGGGSSEEEKKERGKWWSQWKNSGWDRQVMYRPAIHSIQWQKMSLRSERDSCGLQKPHSAGLALVSLSLSLFFSLSAAGKRSEKHPDSYDISLSLTVEWFSCTWAECLSRKTLGAALVQGVQESMAR